MTFLKISTKNKKIAINVNDIEDVNIDDDNNVSISTKNKEYTILCKEPEEAKFLKNEIKDIINNDCVNLIIETKYNLVTSNEKHITI